MKGIIIITFLFVGLAYATIENIYYEVFWIALSILATITYYGEKITEKK